MDRKKVFKKIMDKVIKCTHDLNQRGIITEDLRFDEQQRAFITASMTSAVCNEVIRTLDFHESCQHAGLDDGRRYWCFRQCGEIIGLTGFHYRLWDHADIVWSASIVASAHAPAITRFGMIYNNMYVCLTQTRFRTMYIELPVNDTATNLYSIFKSLGLEEVATFHNFHGKDKDMIVMKIDLEGLREFIREEYGLDCMLSPDQTH